MQRLTKFKATISLSIVTLLVASSLSTIHLTSALSGSIRIDSIRRDFEVADEELKRELTVQADIRVAAIESRLYTIEKRVERAELMIRELQQEE